MKRENIKNINEIKKLSSRFPKTLNEALNFNNVSEEDEIEYEDEMEEPEMGEPEMSEPNASEKARQLIDNIRKMSLRAMAELADTPEDENYIMLKKVWSMTDRKPEQDKNNMQQMNK